MAEHRAPRIAERENEYKQRRMQQIISPERHDPFAGQYHSYFGIWGVLNGVV